MQKKKDLFLNSHKLQSPLVFSFLEFLLLSTHQITTPTITTMGTTLAMEAPITIDKVWSEINSKKEEIEN